jgi:hypothetical protein
MICNMSTQSYDKFTNTMKGSATRCFCWLCCHSSHVIAFYLTVEGKRRRDLYPYIRDWERKKKNKKHTIRVVNVNDGNFSKFDLEEWNFIFNLENLSTLSFYYFLNKILGIFVENSSGRLFISIFYYFPFCKCLQSFSLMTI